MPQELERMTSETMAFQVDFSNEGDSFTEDKLPIQHNGNLHRNSDPIYESIQCSRFLMKRKTNSNKTKPRTSTDYGDFNNSSLNKLSLNSSSISSHTSDKNSTGSWHSASNSSPFEPSVPYPVESVLQAPALQTSMNEWLQEAPSTRRPLHHEAVPTSLPRHSFIQTPMPPTPPTKPSVKKTDDDVVKEAFDFLEDL